MYSARVASVVLAAALQVLPLCRLAVSQSILTPSAAGVVFRWLVGAAMALGAEHAVSGASTLITSPSTAKGTNGVPFTYRITTGPHAANQFGATPLPPGLTVGFTTGRITGTPTSTGTWNVTLTASDNGRLDRTVTALLVLTIVPAAPTPPVISSQPKSVTVTNGGGALFTIAATGTAPLTYQWQKDGVNLTGATGPALTINPVGSADAGAYRVLVSNAAGTAASAAATLTVLVPPFLATQPAAQSVTAGAAVALSVVAGGTAPLSYQWFYNLSAIPGATTDTLSIASTTTANAGDYFVVVSNAVGTVTSATAHLSVQEPIVVKLQLAPGSVTPGGYQFGATGPLNADYIIWASADLVGWQSISTNHVVDGFLQFLDPRPVSQAQFYRITTGQ